MPQSYARHSLVPDQGQRKQRDSRRQAHRRRTSRKAETTMTTQRINAAPTEDLRLLHQAAEAARARAHAPYSNFQVGAALRTSEGRIITAGNVENVVYSSTMCAERAAIFRAVADGYTNFDAIAIAGPAGTISPCGACRQVLAEFMDPSAMVVFPVDTQLVAVPLSKLLPHPFSPPLRPSSG